MVENILLHLKDIQEFMGLQFFKKYECLFYIFYWIGPVLQAPLVWLALKVKLDFKRKIISAMGAFKNDVKQVGEAEGARAETL